MSTIKKTLNNESKTTGASCLDTPFLAVPPRPVSTAGGHHTVTPLTTPKGLNLSAPPGPELHKHLSGKERVTH